jgi:hypothetical protein
MRPQGARVVPNQTRQSDSGPPCPPIKCWRCAGVAEWWAVGGGPPAPGPGGAMGAGTVERSLAASLRRATPFLRLQPLQGDTLDLPPALGAEHGVGSCLLQTGIVRISPARQQRDCPSTLDQACTGMYLCLYLPTYLTYSVHSRLPQPYTHRPRPCWCHGCHVCSRIPYCPAH